MSSSTTTQRASACPFHRLFSIPQQPRVDDRPWTRRVTGAGLGVMAYGLLAYGAFFVIFAYMIGFVGNWLVPKSIDSGVPSPLAEALLVNCSILALFVLQHTIMARRWFKAWWTRVIPASMERSTFVLAASLILMLLVWQWRPLPGVVWHVGDPAGRVARIALSLLGWAIVFASSWMVSHLDLFGLRQVACRLIGRPYEPIGFRLRGLYRVVRHPLMVGFLIAFWATPTMTWGRLLFAGLCTAYILFGTWIEERDLIAEHGERYEAYRRAVPGFVPRLGTRARGAE
jgi:protein-S-isoprenylcysteine O-methyltransferase Ste14